MAKEEYPQPLIYAWSQEAIGNSPGDDRDEPFYGGYSALVGWEDTMRSLKDYEFI